MASILIAFILLSTNVQSNPIEHYSTSCLFEDDFGWNAFQTQDYRLRRNASLGAPARHPDRLDTTSAKTASTAVGGPRGGSYLDGSCYYIFERTNMVECSDMNLSYIPWDIIPTNVTYLSINNINIEKLDSGEFTYRPLKFLSILSTPLTILHSSSFVGLHSLVALNMDGNSISVDPHNDVHFFHMFQELHSLQILILSNNNITLRKVDTKPQDDQPTTLCLREIDLSNNPIRKLERYIFYPLRFSRLQHINLSGSMLESIDPYAFTNLTFLESINLADNPALLQLDVNHPPLSAALYYLPKNSFSDLDLSSNQLLVIPWISLFVMGNSIRSLNLSKNGITSVANSMAFPQMRSLTDLDLSHNTIYSLGSESMQGLSNLERVTVSDNLFCSIPSALRLPYLQRLDISHQYCYDPLLRSKFSLDENSFSGMYSLKSLSIRDVLLQVNTTSFFSCPQLEELDISYYGLHSIAADSFRNLRNLQSLTCSQCWILDPIAIETWQDLKSLKYLDLSYSPLSLKSDSKQGYFGNILENIQVLNLTCALVGDASICNTDQYTYESPLDPQLLIPMIHLEILDLSKNGLTTWQERKFTTNAKLRKLYLAYNKFRSISEAMLEDFKGLEFLYLQANAQAPDIVCNRQVFQFFEWSQNSLNNVTIQNWDDGEGYFCDDIKNNRIRSFRNFSLEYEEPVPVTTSDNSYLVKGCIIGGLISLVTIVISVTVSYRHRLYIHFWIMKKKRMRKPELDRSPPYYDAFVSYSQAEDKWVQETLLPALENEHNLRLCLHHRDFKVGMPVVENIVDSIENSSKFLMILSNSFVSSRWCNFETYVAQQAAPDKDSMNHIVIIILEELEKRPNKNLAFLLKTKTYIKWNEESQKDFWARVTSALRPDFTV